MGRSVVTLRLARVEDAAMLAELWCDHLRRTDHQEQVVDLEQMIASSCSSSGARIVVAEYDEQAAGALLMRVGAINPVNPEQAVHLVGPQVLPGVRRRGVARALMEAAVAFADEVGVAHLGAAAGAGAGARDGNRFLARLAFAPQASYRLAPVAGVRGRLQAQRPHPSTTPRGASQVSRVLAARRSMRRSQSPTT